MKKINKKSLGSLMLPINRLMMKFSRKQKWIHFGEMGTEKDDWNCIRYVWMVKRPCECGEGFINEFIQKWENKYTKEVGKRWLIEFDCPRKCQLCRCPTCTEERERSKIAAAGNYNNVTS